MDEKDQRLYRISIYDGYGHLSEGDRCVNDEISIIGELSRSIFCDYMDIGQDTFESVDGEIVRKLCDMFADILVNRSQNLDGYTLCGLAVKECINGRKGSEDI